MRIYTLLFFSLLSFSSSAYWGFGSQGRYKTTTAASHVVGASSSGNIVLSVVPSRTSGVAPLSVFFTTVGTTDSGVTTRPFHDLEYRWNFGDATTGNWAYGTNVGGSKNQAIGANASHVFETAGTYTVSMAAIDGTGASANTTFTITVSDPETVFASDTLCVSATTDFTGCPSSNHLTVATSTAFESAINSNVATYKRILFHRGHSFSTTNQANILVDGPGIIGAFGTGALPVINKIDSNANYNDIINFGSTATAVIGDWRVMDLEINGGGIRNTNHIVHAAGSGGQTHDILFFRNNIHDVHNGIVFDFNAILNHSLQLWSNIAIVDNIITVAPGMADGWRIYIAAENLAIIGNELGSPSRIGTVGGSHVIRTPYIGKGVIANNSLYAGPSQLAIKMHAPTWCDVRSPVGSCYTPDHCGTICADIATTYGYATGNDTAPIDVFAATSGYTENVVVSDNVFNSSAGTAYLVTTGPQNATLDERVRDVILERNKFNLSGTATTQTAIVVYSQENTIRNNICDLTSTGSGRFCVKIETYGYEPPPSEIRLYNNSIYTGSAAANQLTAISLETNDISNVSVVNNLVYSANSTTTNIVSAAACPACYTASNNSTVAQAKTTYPFVTNPPVNYVDFTPTGYPVGAGTAVPVWSDFFRTLRTGTYDLGAIIH